MFTNLTQIKEHVQLSLQVRREHKRIDEAAKRVANEQKIRHQVMRELSIQGLLKDGVC